MKKFFVAGLFFVLTIFLAGCQNFGGENSVLTQQTQVAAENISAASQQMLGEQGMGNPASQISLVDVEYREKLLAGPVKKCVDETQEGKVFSCYEKYLESRVEEDGAEAAFKDLKILYEAAPIVQTYCHPLVHAIGHEAVEKYVTLSEAYKHGDGYCWSGYYHGVMEEISKKIGRKNLPEKLNEICVDIPGKATYSFDYYNCVHGLGHGVMAITKNELFESLKLCDNIQGNWEQQSCYGGVHMENVIVDNLNHFTKYLKPKEPLYPCTAVDQKYKDSCYLMQTSYALKVTGYDFKQVFDLCETKADKDFVVTCYRSLGRDASGSSISNVEQTKTNCFLGKDYTQQSECIVGAVKDFISYFHSDVEGKQLCNALGDAKMTQYCLDTAKEYYKSF